MRPVSSSDLGSASHANCAFVKKLERLSDGVWRERSYVECCTVTLTPLIDAAKDRGRPLAGAAVRLMKIQRAKRAQNDQMSNEQRNEDDKKARDGDEQYRTRYVAARLGECWATTEDS